MVDKNHNGIDDVYEKYKPNQKLANGRSSRAGVNPFFSWLEDDLGFALPGMARQGLNAVSSGVGGVNQFFGGKPQETVGTGLGDRLFGVRSNYYDDANRGVMAAAQSGEPWVKGSLRAPTSDWWNYRNTANGTERNPNAPAVEDPNAPKPLSFLDALAQASGIVDGMGLGQAVDYSPAVNEANSTRDKNSAYLGAIYNQLRGEIDKDRPVIQQNFGDAISTNQDITRTAQDATQEAYGAAQRQASQEGQALGMQTAQASINTERPGLLQQAANAVEDQADRGQNAQTMYNTNQANALEHNTNIRGASNFAETRSQAELNSSLAQRLAELSVAQSEANSAAQNERGSAITSLGQYLYGDSQSQGQQEYENMLAAAEAQAKAGGGQQAPAMTLAQLMQGQADSGLPQQDYLSFMKLLASLND
jgi:hypothetical protein